LAPVPASRLRTSGRAARKAMGVASPSASMRILQSASDHSVSPQLRATRSSIVATQHFLPAVPALGQSRDHPIQASIVWPHSRRSLPAILGAQYTVVRSAPSVEDYRSLRAAAGLSERTEEAARRGLLGTLFSVQLCWREACRNGPRRRRRRVLPPSRGYRRLTPTSR